MAKNDPKRLANKLAAKAIGRLSRILTQDEEIMGAFIAGMNNAIYDWPQTPNYKRTGSLKESVRYDKVITGTGIYSRVYVDGNVLRSLNKKNYAKYIYLDQKDLWSNNTVQGLGFYPFSVEHVMRFFINDLKRVGRI